MRFSSAPYPLPLVVRPIMRWSVTGVECELGKAGDLTRPRPRTALAGCLDIPAVKVVIKQCFVIRM